jgi:hypothetical protein
MRNQTIELEEFRKSLENQRNKKQSEKKDEIKRIEYYREKFGIGIISFYIEGSDMFSFASANPNIIETQIFMVYNKKTEQYFLAYYYATENAFVDIYDDDKLYYDEGNWENNLDQYKAQPIYLLFK